MFKKILFLFFFIFIFNISLALSNEKIVYLDVDYIINKSKPAISIIKKMEKIKDKQNKELKAAETKLKKNNDEIIKSKNLLSDEEFKNKVSKFRQEVQSFEKAKIKSINDIKKRRNKELNEFLKLINPLIQEYMDKNSIDVVIDKKNIFIAKSDRDITKDILEIVNNKIK